MALPSCGLHLMLPGTMVESIAAEYQGSIQDTYMQIQHELPDGENPVRKIPLTVTGQDYTNRWNFCQRNKDQFHALLVLADQCLLTCNSCAWRWT
jgi:hypothetical protein